MTSEDQRNVDEKGKSASVPWHHAQLYRMYGTDADYFLHPTIDVDKLAGKSAAPARRIKTDHGIYAYACSQT